MLLSLAVLAAAQDLSSEIRREVARDQCRQPGDAPDDEIIVCHRRDGPKRYQVTDPRAPFDPRGNKPSVARERFKAVQEGETGIQSCGAVGPAAWTGCLLKEWRDERQQQGQYGPW